MDYEAQYEHVRSVYDRIAPQYDEAGGQHAVSRRAKQLALHVFKNGLASLLGDSSRFVCGLLNPTVMYELLMAPLFGKFHGYRKLRKQEVVTRVGLGDDTVKASLYSVDDAQTLMAPEFQLERILGVHILYPPPRGSQGHGRWWLARALDEVELRLQSRFPFRNFGFFSLLVFRRAAA